jgi:hypothetical protein
MYNLGCNFDRGEGMAARDDPAAAGWYRHAAEAGHGAAAATLSNMYSTGRGRS